MYRGVFLPPWRSLQMRSGLKRRSSMCKAAISTGGRTVNPLLFSLSSCEQDSATIEGGNVPRFKRIHFPTSCSVKGSKVTQSLLVKFKWKSLDGMWGKPFIKDQLTGYFCFFAIYLFVLLPVGLYGSLEFRRTRSIMKDGGSPSKRALPFCSLARKTKISPCVWATD